MTKDIPPKEETIIDVELTMVQKKYYRAIYERNHSVLNKVKKSGYEYTAVELYFHVHVRTVSFFFLFLFRLYVELF